MDDLDELEAAQYEPACAHMWGLYKEQAVYCGTATPQFACALWVW